MPTLPLNIDAIELRALKDLRAEGSCQDRQLDLKRDVKFGTDAEKGEILANISFFADALESRRLFGVDDDPNEGFLIGEILGVERDYDLTVLKLDGSLRRGVNPRIPGIRFHGIPTTKSRLVLWSEDGKLVQPLES